MPEYDESQNEKGFEPDPGHIAFLDQEEARFAEVSDEFEAYYGFHHECHCGEDYAAGRVVEIPLCYANLLGEAMEACSRLKKENDLYLELAQALATRLEEEIGEQDEQISLDESVEQERADLLDDESTDSPSNPGPTSPELELVKEDDLDAR